MPPLKSDGPFLADTKMSDVDGERMRGDGMREFESCMRVADPLRREDLGHVDLKPMSSRAKGQSSGDENGSARIQEKKPVQPGQPLNQRHRL